MNSKIKLRKKYLAIRAAIPPSYREEAAKAAANFFAAHPAFAKSKHIACYLPFKSEFDSSALIEVIWQAKKKCYLPVLTEEKSLIFVRYQYGDALHPNRYTILEPVNRKQKIAKELLDIVITPFVAFDLQGHRLGTGGGYYDRTFAFLREEKLNQPLMLGLGYAAQQAPLLPVDVWDVMLNGVVTEEGVMYVMPARF